MRGTRIRDHLVPFFKGYPGSQRRSNAAHLKRRAAPVRNVSRRQRFSQDRVLGSQLATVPLQLRDAEFGAAIRLGSIGECGLASLRSSTSLRQR